MTTLVKGLKAMSDILEGPKQTEKTVWFNSPERRINDGESVFVRFINELDEDSPNYDPDRGLAIVVAEHTNPDNYKLKAVCTAETEGRCFGCEMHQKSQSDPDYKGKWRAKYGFYINLWVQQGNDEYVAVWNRAASNRSPVFNYIVNHVKETGSISNALFKVTRRGAIGSTDTTYNFFTKSVDDSPYDWSGVEPYDLEKVIRQVPYAEQELFYMGDEAAEDSSNGKAKVATATLDW